MWVWLAIVAALIMFGVLVWDSSERPAGAPETTGSSAVTANGDEGQGDGDRVTEAAFDTTVWFAGFTIRTTAARFDGADRLVRVDVVFTNDQHDSADPCALLLEDGALVVDGRRFMLWNDQCTRLSPGTSTRAILEATVDDEVNLHEASIEFGGAEEHRAIVPLDGRPGTSSVPSTRQVGGALDGEVSSFTAEEVEVVPAACWGLSSELGFVPGRSDEMSIVVTGSVTSRSEYPIVYGKARLTLPDGTALASSSLSGAIYLVDPGETVRDVKACFIVPSPVTGGYEFTITSDGPEAFPDSIVLTL